MWQFWQVCGSLPTPSSSWKLLLSHSRYVACSKPSSSCSPSLSKTDRKMVWQPAHTREVEMYARSWGSSPKDATIGSFAGWLTGPWMGVTPSFSRDTLKRPVTMSRKGFLSSTIWWQTMH
jgi:hypothetical protein